MLGFDLPLITERLARSASSRRRSVQKQAPERRPVADADGVAAMAAWSSDRQQAPAGADVAFASTLDTLRRKGFGRLLIDGQAVIARRCRCQRAGRRGDAAGHRRSTRRSKASCGRGSPTPSRPLIRKAVVLPGPSSSPSSDGGSRPRRIRSRSGSNAGAATSPTKIRSRGCSPSTTRSAPVRRVTASATSSSSTWI